MRFLGLAAVLAAGVMFGSVAQAQTTPAAPEAVTATCKDGTTFTGTSRSGACRGHKGVAEFTSTAPGAKAPVAAAAPAATPAPAAAPKPSVTTPKPATTAKPAEPMRAQAPGGGPGKVWVNTASKVYHCQGDKYYGTTKAGEYMTEAAAKAAGNHAEKGKACGS